MPRRRIIARKTTTRRVDAKPRQQTVRGRRAPHRGEDWGRFGNEEMPRRGEVGSDPKA